MSLNYNENYFINSNPNLDENYELREPQIEAYYRTYDHFVTNNKKNHAVIILPTGVGKTGLIGLLPYKICKGRVLIISPRLVIKDGIVNALNPNDSSNFWLKRKIFNDINDLPVLIEYEGKKTNLEWLESANIVVLNIHKLQNRLDSSLINRVNNTFFDMIIIDEAHHSTANTWVETTNYFNNAKVIKLTGTPFRSDGISIIGKNIYEYALSKAMAKGYIKSLVNFSYVPDKLYLYIEGDSKEYTVEELYEKGIKDEEWVSKSITYSRPCSEKVVEKSIELLKKKKEGSNVPHKIIAVASSILHAEQIQSIYQEKNINSVIIHSGLSKEEIDSNLSDIENNRVEAIINVSMLGEGYDHPYLSVAAIFRPFRTILPYQQFVGRILRKIPDNEASKANDNIGDIVSHKFLQLDNLWKYYKDELEESKVIEFLQSQELPDDDFDGISSRQRILPTFGTVKEEGKGTLVSDAFLNSELIKQREKEESEEKIKFEGLKNLLKISDDEIKKMLGTLKGNDNKISRPDLYFKKIGKDVDTRIKEDIVPRLITKYNLEKESDSLKNCNKLFTFHFSWIQQKSSNNAAMLAIYFNYSLVKKIGRKKENWTTDDFNNANDKLDEIEEFVDQVLKDFTK